MGDGADDALDAMFDQDALELEYGWDFDRALQDGVAEQLFDYDGTYIGGVFSNMGRHKKKQSPPPPPCPWCGSQPVLIDSAEIYHGKSYGWAWRCPHCEGVYVGCHNGTKNPLGTLANADLRVARMHAHRAFDQTWRDTGTKRSNAYAWLAKQLGIDEKDCHIAMMDEATCRRVVEIVKGMQKLP